MIQRTSNYWKFPKRKLFCFVSHTKRSNSSRKNEIEIYSNYKQYWSFRHLCISLWYSILLWPNEKKKKFKLLFGKLMSFLIILTHIPIHWWKKRKSGFEKWRNGGHILFALSQMMFDILSEYENLNMKFLFVPFEFRVWRKEEDILSRWFIYCFRSCETSELRDEFQLFCVWSGPFFPP